MLKLLLSSQKMRLLNKIRPFSVVTTKPTGEYIRACPILLVPSVEVQFQSEPLWERIKIELLKKGFETGVLTWNDEGNNSSIKNSLSQIKAATDTLMYPPIVISHGTSGFLVQKYLESHALTGAIFLSPFPPTPTKTVERLCKSPHNQVILKNEGLFKDMKDSNNKVNIEPNPVPMFVVDSKNSFTTEIDMNAFYDAFPDAEGCFFVEGSQFDESLQDDVVQSVLEWIDDIA